MGFVLVNLKGKGNVEEFFDLLKREQVNLAKKLHFILKLLQAYLFLVSFKTPFLSMYEKWKDAV